MAVQIQLRRDTASNWTSANPTLAAGAFAIETDTDKYKIGDGSTAWTSLGYSSLPSGSVTTAGGVTITGTMTHGADGTGADVRLNTGTAGDFVLWDASDKALEFTDSKITMGDNLIETPVLKDIGETCVANATSGATDTIDLEDGNVHNVTLTANCTFTFSNPPASGTSGSFTLFLNQDGTGSRTATWPGSVKWAGGTAPTLTTTASRTDILVFTTIDGGTIWYGAVSGQDFS